MIHKPKKSLGQNFLKSALALKKIIEAGEISSDDIILEIGPGKGALTEKLLEKAGIVIAVEKDNNLFYFLKEKFSKEIEAKKLLLLNEDILKYNLPADLLLWGVSQADEPRGSAGLASPDSDPRKVESAGRLHNYKIIANIPYNITGAILEKFLTEKLQPNMMVLMVQQEVARRIVAQDKKESILSISVKAYGEPKIIMKVPARYFSPAPKVDSAIIAIKNISRKRVLPLLNKERAGVRFLDSRGLPSGTGKDIHLGASATLEERNKIDEQKFWEIVHAGFAHKRKKLSGNLKNIIKDIPEEYKNKRAEDLNLLDWISLSKN